MFCPECRAEYRPGFTRCSDCDVELVSAIPAQNKRVRPDSATVFLTGGSPKLLAAFIRLAYIPAGFVGLFIAERLPRWAQLPFAAFMIGTVIYYRFVGAQKLIIKLTQQPQDESPGKSQYENGR